jgi:hypothetical protein
MLVDKPEVMLVTGISGTTTVVRKLRRIDEHPVKTTMSFIIGNVVEGDDAPPPASPTASARHQISPRLEVSGSQSAQTIGMEDELDFQSRNVRTAA